MNRLEQYIHDNISLFDEEPETDHFERLQQKMNRKSRRTTALRWYISTAASITIILSAGMMWQHAGKRNDSMVMCENTMDIKNCYLNKMNVVAGRIELLTKHLDPWDQHQVMTDVQNIIEATGSGFENEIPEELPAGEAKLILSDYYRQNLESLVMIAKKLAIINDEYQSNNK